MVAHNKSPKFSTRILPFFFFFFSLLFFSFFTTTTTMTTTTMRKALLAYRFQRTFSKPKARGKRRAMEKKEDYSLWEQEILPHGVSPSA